MVLLISSIQRRILIVFKSHVFHLLLPHHPPCCTLYVILMSTTKKLQPSIITKKSNYYTSEGQTIQRHLSFLPAFIIGSSISSIIMFTSFYLFLNIAAILASRTTMILMVIIIFQESDGFSPNVFMNVRGAVHDPLATSHDVKCNTSFKPSPTLSEQQYNNHRFLNKSTRIIQTKNTKPSIMKIPTTVFNRTTTISSMVLFAKMIHHYHHDKNTSTKQTFSSSSPKSTVTTRTQIHLSRLSDTSTYEFQRREHIEIVSGEGAGIYDQVGLHDKSCLGIDNIEKIDDMFVQEQFEKGDMAFSKAELDRFITTPGQEEIFVNENTYMNDVESYDRRKVDDSCNSKYR